VDKEARLKELVKSFFEDYLDYTEVSDSDKEFNPIYISSCRVIRLLVKTIDDSL
jgi:hypothetical protein